MDKTWVIYRHINNINGKSYIGQTCQNPPSLRWRDGKHYAGYFAQAINKYGWDNFSHEILEEGITTQEEANQRESYWINFYDSFNNGYNLTLGGETAHNLCKPILKIDINTHEILARYNSKEEAERENQGRNFSTSCLDPNHKITSKGFLWCYEEDYSPEIFKNVKVRVTNSREVLQISPIDFSIIASYPSISSAARQMGKTPSAIKHCCQNTGYTCNFYFWCYAEEYCDGWRPSQDKAHWRPIYNFTNDIIYINLDEAVQNTGLPRHTIHTRCARRSHNVDVKLCFLSEKDQFIQEENEKNAK